MSVVKENEPTRSAVARFWMCTFYPGAGVRVMSEIGRCVEPGDNIKHLQYDMSKLDPLCNWPTCQIGKDEDLQGVVYQVEICPETKREHVQLYAEFARPVRFKHVQTLLNMPNAHCETRKKSREACVAYCTKQDSRKPDTCPVYLGTLAEQPDGSYKTRQGKRTDIHEMVDAIKAGKRQLDVMEQDPDTFVKYHRGMSVVREMYQREAARKPRQLQVTAFIGAPGTGKTRSVYEKHGYENVFTVVACSAQQMWFDGYEGESVLLIDDFKGWIQYSFLLKLLDVYPLRLPVKGTFTHAMWTKVYITSNYPVDQWYQDATLELGALRRRIHSTIKFGVLHAAHMRGTATAGGDDEVTEVEEVGEGGPKELARAIADGFIVPRLTRDYRKPPALQLYEDDDDETDHSEDA